MKCLLYLTRFLDDDTIFIYVACDTTRTESKQSLDESTVDVEYDVIMHAN